MNLTKLKILILSLFLSIPFMVKAQDVTTVTATDDEISQNLDLEVVAAIFGESKDLEDFEKKLNDPEQQISNLDLNGDGEVDYLRVVDTSKKNTHVVTIQAVIGKDQYQDVAVIDVVKDEKGETQVQVVGDVYMYGSNYIVEPIYVHQPVIYVWFWGPYYHPWRSPYYWGYYPPYYRPWRPYPVPYYRSNVRVNINIHHKHKYRHTTVRRSKHAVKMQKQTRRRDYAKQYPNKSFDKRHKDISNASQLKQRPATSDVKSKPQTKPATKPEAKPAVKPEQGVSKDKRPSNSKENTSKPSNDKSLKPAQPSLKDKQTGQVSTGQKVNKNWKTSSDRSGNKSNVKNNKVSVPTQRPSNNKSNSKQNKSNYNKQNKTRENKSYNKSNSNTKQNKMRPTTSPNNNMNKSYNRPQTRPATTRPATRPSNYNNSMRPSPSRSAAPSRSRR